MQPLRMAFMGFRHGHIHSLYRLAETRPDVTLVAACEEDADTRAALAAGSIAVTHDDYRRMLDTVECDAVAVGDYYGKRGAIIIEALRRGKHVIGDKPLCTALEEHATIAALAGAGGLSVGCQLDMREHPAIRCLRDAVHAGAIGAVLSIAFNGQHPLNYGSRPGWYFEPGKHGGTLNDLAIHAFDFIPWATGARVERINAARGWNARLPQAPWFQDGAQVMATLDTGAGVLGDVSYFTPDSIGYALPQYWRFTIWGAEGMLEGGINVPVTLYRNGARDAEVLPLPATQPGAYLHSFLSEIRGETTGITLSTADVLDAARVTLLVQQAADEGTTNVDV